MRWACVAAIVPLLLAGRAAGAPLPGAPPLPPEVAARIERALTAVDPDTPPRTRHLDAAGRPKYANRLILETSPYLLQHAHNPVSWYPWGEDAFRAARELDRPVFLSVGYSTCHWCHVMEEESFEDPEIAELLNRHFVAIKVDREERPDVDGLYMEAVQAISGSGGWPMSVFLAPNGHPFFAGTYFPPRDRPGSPRPGFLTVLQRIHATYETERERIVEISDRLARTLERGLDPETGVGMPGAETLRAALATYEAGFDRENGGLRSRTKFPSSLPIPFLLRMHRRTGETEPLEMARQTLDAMRHGGIYDHVGGGFHRYTVEPSWTVPHFEKMLYDSALLALAYTEAWQVTGDASYAEVLRDVLAYLERDMRSPLGTFHAATDADSEGEEGAYFVWTPEEIRAAVGPDLAPLALLAFGVGGEANFSRGRTVLRRDLTPDEIAEPLGMDAKAAAAKLAQARERLRAAREKRVAPHTDRKQIVAWNGLAISAFARAGLALREPGLVESAARAARAILTRGRPDGRLARYLAGGSPHGTGLLDDHAFLIAGLLDLHEAQGDPSWLEAAIGLQADLDRHFFDDARGGYYVSPAGGERLLVREKPMADGALPSGNSVATLNLLRLWLLTTDPAYREHAEMTVRAFSDYVIESPTGFGRMLDAVDFLLDRPKEILVVTPRSREEAEPFLRDLGRVFLPNRVLVVAPEPEIPALARRVPLLERKRALDGKATAYVCENRVCDLPARDVATFARQIRAKPAPYPLARAASNPTP